MRLYNTSVVSNTFSEYKIDTFLLADMLTRQVVNVFIQKVLFLIFTIRMYSVAVVTKHSILRG